MKTVSSFLFTAVVAASALPLLAGYELSETQGQHLDVLKDGKTVARYMVAYDTSTKEKQHDTYKPYLHVFNAGGDTLLTKGPGGDFTHHRGIFLGWNKLKVGEKTYDRWHMKNGAQVHSKFVEKSAGATSATFTSLVHWQGDGAAAAPVLEDERTFQFLPGTGPFYAVVDVTSKLKAIAGDTVFDGDPEHAGLQFRPAQEVDRTKTTYLYPKAGANPQKDLDYPWFAESFVLNHKPYSVVYLSHPENPTGTRTSAYRDYGRFGSFFKTSIKSGETLTLKVRFLLAEGPLPSADVIQKEWNRFAGKEAPTPETTLKMMPPAKPKPAADVKKSN